MAKKQKRQKNVQLSFDNYLNALQRQEQQRIKRERAEQKQEAARLAAQARRQAAEDAKYRQIGIGIRNQFTIAATLIVLVCSAVAFL